MNVRAEIKRLSECDGPEEGLAAIKAFTQKLRQNPDLSDEDKLYIQENLIKGLRHEIETGRDPFPEEINSELIVCLSELDDLTHHEVKEVKKEFFDANLNSVSDNLTAILMGYDAQAISQLLENLIERITQLKEVDEDKLTDIKKKIIYPLVRRLRFLDDKTAEESARMLSALSTIIRLTHTSPELCTYIATQMQLPNNEDADVDVDVQDLKVSYPSQCGFFYEILSEPRRVELGETSEEYWDRYTYLISLHEIGYEPHMLTWRLLTLAQAEMALAEGKETDFLDKKSPLSFPQAKEDHIQMMQHHPQCCLRAEERLWRTQLMGPLLNTKRLINIISSTKLAMLEHEFPRLSETIIQHLTETMMCSLTVPDVRACAQSLLKIYDGMLDHLQQQEHTQQMALDLGNRLLTVLQNPEWPQKFSLTPYDINHRKVVSYLSEYVDALSKRINDQNQYASPGFSRRP